MCTLLTFTLIPASRVSPKSKSHITHGSAELSKRGVGFPMQLSKMKQKKVTDLLGKDKCKGLVQSELAQDTGSGWRRLSLKRLQRELHYLTHWRKFQKPLHAIVVLGISYNPKGRNDAFFQYLLCPIQKDKRTAVFFQSWVVFESQWRGIFFREKVSFCFMILEPTYIRLFVKFSNGLRYGGVSECLAGHNQKKWSVSKGKIWKVGDQICLSRYFSAFTRLTV